MQRWDQIEAFMCDEAEADLCEGQGIRPCFAAYTGESPLFLAFLRPFEKGHYDEPLIELIALAAPLGADRLAVSIGARAWSLNDPIPPVSATGDMRQRVLVVERADGSQGEPRSTSAVWPFDLVGGQVRWGDPLRTDEETGWISGALSVTVRNRNKLRGPEREIRKQARRCVALGHLMVVSPEVDERLGLAGRRK